MTAMLLQERKQKEQSSDIASILVCDLLMYLLELYHLDDADY